MPDKDAGTPRVILLRHGLVPQHCPINGETEWTKTGQYTGKTDIPLTAHGEAQVLSTRQSLIGPGKLIDPAKLTHVYISPRSRAVRTYELTLGEADRVSLEGAGKVERTERLAEWGYGDYEGLLTGEIRNCRKVMGLDVGRKWDIWRDGCEGGEMPGEVEKRLDELIEEIRGLQKGSMHGETPADVFLVAHGHILRAFVKRWLGYPLELPLSIMFEPGGVAISITV
ncbi:MAG: hypothetical protein M1814_000829 [Vezdaea aestivalis]|nr:MAG: hypothetical protein M1814_000829 [Vezdaea aestivalis]